MDCQHLWLPKKRGIHDYDTSDYHYQCKNCKRTIDTDDYIPCKHDWQQMEHNYGINYLKLNCLHCDKTKIKTIN